MTLGFSEERARAGLEFFRADDGGDEVEQAALIEGEESGQAGPFDSEAFLARMHAKYDAKNDK